jgi:glycerol kinase
MKKYIVSIDQGTTSTRAILFDKQGDVVCSEVFLLKQTYPKSGWVEIDPELIYQSVLVVVNNLITKNNIDINEIDSLGITNQRETTVLFEKNTGKPIYNAIVWQSRQSHQICEDIISKGYSKLIQEKTGLIVNPYFSASKILWIFENVPNAFIRAKNHEILFGTIDTWIIYRLTNLLVHATDITNASRTMLFNINTLQWDCELLKMFDIPIEMLPTVHPCSYDYGNATNLYNLPIHGVAGDQHAALFGQCCFSPGEAKNTYGTGCFLLLNTGTKPIQAKSGLISTIAYQINDEVYYALEGSIFIGGSVMQWLRDELKLINNVQDTSLMAKSVIDTNGVYLVPAFTGLGTPYWDDQARGAIFGMSRGTNKNHVVRAALESIAFQSKDVFEVMKKTSGLKLSLLAVDGGASQNDFLLQFQADILQCPIYVPKYLESTALGVAYFAGLYSSFYTSLAEIKKNRVYQQIYRNTMDKNDVTIKYNYWKKAIKATKIFK